ncbi:uncharacterized protein BX663DRAFT_513653 [Cokeromyces recurvatus]|uniref:uncharacterized protein n=1 Tax=Cokeromyces recurvatus TaxID=90255 RepID=UPI00221E6158|nr:uncharacterized protein BX663DRAFT_513653 [Cokeromyces recurvatus]KAI7901678.1 hypothetical protein BX663DRAFT_513653 [Cokeromyces recurvatus]
MTIRKVTLTLFSSSTCSLCNTAKQAILNVQKKKPFALKVLDIHNKEECPKEFSDKYMFDIPVVHLNDQFLMQHRVSEDSLLNAIQLYESTGKINPKY